MVFTFDDVNGRFRFIFRFRFNFIELVAIRLKIKKLNKQYTVKQYNTIQEMKCNAMR